MNPFFETIIEIWEDLTTLGKFTLFPVIVASLICVLPVACLIIFPLFWIDELMGETFLKIQKFFSKLFFKNNQLGE